jgi:hypothetical protein
MLSAIDCSPNRLCIKICVKASIEVIYDNMLGMADDADSTKAIKGGSMIIHNSKRVW